MSFSINQLKEVIIDPGFAKVSIDGIHFLKVH